MGTMHLIKRIMLVSAVLVLASCASVGNEKVGKLDLVANPDIGLRKQMSQADVEKVFGKTQDQLVFPNGDQLWLYSYQKSIASIQNYLPELSFFGGTQRNEHRELVVLFDAQGRLKKWRFNQSGSQQGIGMLNQPISP